ncbi:hypothetical protein PS15p_201632 [Mucor circinelloides]
MLNTITDHASLSDSQHHITETETEEEEQGNVDANSQIENVTSSLPKSEDKLERNSEDGLEKESEHESELEIKQMSGQESEQNPQQNLQQSQIKAHKSTKLLLIKDKQQPSKDKPDSVPINTPSPIKKKNDKAAKSEQRN